MTRIDEIAARANRATPGPWWYQEEECWFGCGNSAISNCGVIASAEYNWENGEPTLEIEPADSAFIAHAREDIPALLGEIARLTARAEKAERERDAAVEDICAIAACDTCKHYDPDENSCARPFVESYKCFEWRGPREAGKGERVE